LRGELALRIDASLAHDLGPGTQLTIKQNETCTVRELLSCAPYKGGLFVRLSGIGTREEAATLIGAEVSVPREDLPALEDGQYYDIDLLGCSVFSTDGELLGELKQVIPTGANDVYVVVGPKGEILVPAINDVVREIDATARKLVVESDGLVWPEPPAKPKGDDR
jgi:16S rRNA processing protein RimM